MEDHNEYDIERLRYYYFEKQLPIVEIAKLCSTPYPKMYHILKKTFPNIEYRKVKRGRLRQNLTRAELIELHYEKRLSLLEIAKMNNTTYNSVHLYMKELNLPTNQDIIRKEIKFPDYKFIFVEYTKQITNFKFIWRMFAFKNDNSEPEYSLNHEVTPFTCCFGMNDGL